MSMMIVENRRVQDSNPFYECVKEYLDTSNLEQRLICTPLAGIDVTNMPLEQRYRLLDRMQEEMFEPTTTSLDITTRIYRMIGRGLQSMDPTKASVRKFSMSIARCAGADLRTLPWFSTFAIGMSIKGPTGSGKTYEVERALKLIPQRIDHRASEAAGWTHMVQAVWLRVPMSHDGSLGGLLFQILCSLDAAIETSYSEDRSLTSLSNEKLAIRVGIILRKHGVGLLAIDEIQERNFSENPRGTLAATFFLRLLNFGIPILLMGNPFGIDALNKFSQDLRRLGAGGAIEMYPHDVTEWDWARCLSPAIWRFCVMPAQSDTSFMTPEILFHYSGGIRDYGCRIWAATQRAALDLGKASVSAEDLQQAFMSSDFGHGERQLIAGLRDKDLALLSQFIDIPWETYGVRWGLLSPAQRNEVDQHSAADATAENPTSAADTGGTKVADKAPAAKAAETMRRKRTTKKNSESQRQEIKKTLDESDIRSNGLQKILISGFEALRQSGL
jgi:hypothetical protein